MTFCHSSITCPPDKIGKGDIQFSVAEWADCRWSLRVISNSWRHRVARRLWKIKRYRWFCVNWQTVSFDGSL